MAPGCDLYGPVRGAGAPARTAAAGAPPGDSEIKFLRLKLTDEDKKALEKSYGK